MCCIWTCMCVRFSVSQLCLCMRLCWWISHGFKAVFVLFIRLYGGYNSVYKTQRCLFFFFHSSSGVACFWLVVRATVEYERDRLWWDNSMGKNSINLYDSCRKTPRYTHIHIVWGIYACRYIFRLCFWSSFDARRLGRPIHHSLSMHLFSAHFKCARWCAVCKRFYRCTLHIQYTQQHNVHVGNLH